MAEIVKHYFPHLVEIHNYSAAHSVSQKTYNWNTLNQKVFKKIGFTLIKKDIDDAVNCMPDVVEKILKLVHTHVIPSFYLTIPKDQALPRKEGREVAIVWLIAVECNWL